MTLESLIAAYGLPALALGALIEGETVLMIGGALVHRGLIDFAAAVAAASLGSFIGDQAWFLLARRYRDTPRIRAMRARPAFARAQAIFERHPALFVFGFRFIYGMRTVSPIAIGVTEYPVLRFMAINAVAAVIWSALFITLGYAFGHGIEAALGRLAAAEHAVAALLVAAVAGTGLHWLWRWRMRRAS